MKVALFAFSALFMIGLSPALAKPLELEEVIVSVKQTHPKIESARAKVNAQAGKVLGARSVFEPKTKVEAMANPSGYYENFRLNSSIEQQIPDSGIKISAGYRQGLGDFAPYYGERETRDVGEMFGKLSVPLWADRSIDSDRAKLQIAQLSQELQTTAFQLTWLEVARDAALAYWNWVAVGQQLEVAQSLLVIATERARRIAQQVQNGSAPRISLVDAKRVLLQRQSSLNEANQKFTNAQVKLALYYRDQELKPIFVPASRVPNENKAVLGASFSGSDTDALADAMKNRPESTAFKIQNKTLAVDMQAAQNKASPRLNLKGELARDFGQGPEALGQTDLRIGVLFELPLFRREGRGAKQRVTAEKARVVAEMRGFRDSLSAEIKRQRKLAQLALDRVELSKQWIETAVQLADAERKRLSQGMSDVLRVNLRELDQASAAKSLIDARLEFHRTQVLLRYLAGRF